MTAAELWPPVAPVDRDAFHQTADRFLHVANGHVVGDAAPERVAAAFFYAHSRFAAFALQADRGGDDPAARDWLEARFEAELADHMLQRLRQDGTLPVPAEQVPDAALDVLMSLNAMSTEDRSAFLSLADTFIRPANELIGENGIAWTAAAMMHACSRFNAYVMQARGLEAGAQDPEITKDFRTGFGDLLAFHLGQSLVADRGE